MAKTENMNMKRSEFMDDFFKNALKQFEFAQSEEDRNDITKNLCELSAGKSAKMSDNDKKFLSEKITSFGEKYREKFKIINIEEELYMVEFCTERKTSEKNNSLKIAAKGAAFYINSFENIAKADENEIYKVFSEMFCDHIYKNTDVLKTIRESFNESEIQKCENEFFRCADITLEYYMNERNIEIAKARKLLKKIKSMYLDYSEMLIYKKNPSSVLNLERIISDGPDFERKETELIFKMEEYTNYKIDFASVIRKTNEKPHNIQANPYELCFGILCLLANERAYSYLFETINTVICIAEKMMPEYVENAVTPKNSGDNDKYFNKKYSVIMENGDEIEMNIYQLVYCLTGKKIFPRVEKKVILKENGENELLSVLIHELNCKNTDVLETELNKLKKTAEKYKTEKAVLESENGKLKKKLALLEYEKAKRLSDTASEDREKKAKIHTDDTENKNNEKTAEKEVRTEEKIKPFRPKKKILVVGGHDSWLREIKKLVIGVTFVRPETKTNPTLVKNSDVVWFQTNAIPHMQYDKVLEITRTNNIPVKYFSCAGAYKCALQIYEEEQGNA